MMERDIEAIRECYHDICVAQRDAIDDLRLASSKKDPPSLGRQLLLGAAEAAIGGAFGALGKAVQIALVGRSTDVSVKVFAKLISDTTKKFAESSARTGVATLIDGGGTSIDSFWMGQRDALTQAAHYQKLWFIDHGAPRLRNAADGVRQAADLRIALGHAYKLAKQTQLKGSLEQWCVYLAHTSLGTTIAGEPRLGGGPFGMSILGAGDGVLGLVVSVDAPGDMPKIRYAYIDGLNKRLRNRLAVVAVKDLGIPKIIDVEFTSRDPFTVPGGIEFGVQVDGTPVWSETNHQAGRWLSRRAALAGSRFDDPVRGMRLLSDDLGALTLKGKLGGR